MIEKFEDLFDEQVSDKLEDIKERDERLEAVDKHIQEKLNISFIDMKKALSAATVANAEELTHEFVNVAPHGDYEKLLEDNDSMALFFKEEAHKPENWDIEALRPVENKSMPNLITFAFYNKAVDDGSTMKGFVYVSFEGKIKHAFAQGEE